MRRLRFDEDAQLRIAHWLAEKGLPIGFLLALGLLILFLEAGR